MIAELRTLCEQQRRIILEADRGSDCGLEARELSRLVELEEELVQELSDVRAEPPISQAEGAHAVRMCRLQGDIGGGCEAVVEGQKENDPPLQTRIVSIEEVLKDLEGW